MELKEFITASLQQIVEGVKEAQASPDGGNINAATVSQLTGATNIIHAHGSGVFTVVQFDVAVSAEASGKAGAGVKVWGIGAEAGGERKSGNVSRISFAVPVRLPDGDKTRAREIEARMASSNQSSRWTPDEYLDR